MHREISSQRGIGIWHTGIWSPCSISDSYTVHLYKCSKSAKLSIYSLTQTTHMSMFGNNALLGGGVRVRVWIREQRKIKRRLKALLSL